MIGRMECWLLVVGVKQGKGGSSVKAGAPHVKHIPVTQRDGVCQCGNQDTLALATRPTRMLYPNPPLALHTLHLADTPYETFKGTSKTSLDPLFSLTDPFSHHALFSLSNCATPAIPFRLNPFPPLRPIATSQCDRADRLAPMA